MGFYLSKRGRATDWWAASAADQEAATIAATDYLEKTNALRFRGTKEFLALEAHAFSVFNLAALPSLDDLFTLGTATYTWVIILAAPNDVLIGASTSDCATNLEQAINAFPAGSGVSYGVGTVANTLASGDGNGPAVVATALSPGEDGNSTPTTSSSLVNTWTTGTLFDGGDSVEQPLSFPRTGLYSRAGLSVTGVPADLRQAQAEYASRALAAILDPDPVIDPTGKSITGKREKVGPIETESSYSEGGGIEYLTKPYPAADSLLAQYLFPAGRVYRG